MSDPIQMTQAEVDRQLASNSPLNPSQRQRLQTQIEQGYVVIVSDAGPDTPPEPVHEPESEQHCPYETDGAAAPGEEETGSEPEENESQSESDGEEGTEGEQSEDADPAAPSSDLHPENGVSEQDAPSKTAPDGADEEKADEDAAPPP